jgi:hypothetical protein
MSESPGQIYSLSMRLQRTTKEFAFVKVPIRGDILIEQPDGTGRLDPAKVNQIAIELGRAPGVIWTIEEQSIQPHPWQTPPPTNT